MFFTLYFYFVCKTKNQQLRGRRGAPAGGTNHPCLMVKWQMESHTWPMGVTLKLRTTWVRRLCWTDTTQVQRTESRVGSESKQTSMASYSRLQGLKLVYSVIWSPPPPTLLSTLCTHCRCAWPQPLGQRLRQRSLLRLCWPVWTGRGKKTLENFLLGLVVVKPFTDFASLFQISDRTHLLDDLEEGESRPPVEEMQELQLNDPPQVVRCGGEDGDSGRPMSQRQRSHADMRESSLARRGRGRCWNLKQ